MKYLLQFALLQFICLTSFAQSDKEELKLTGKIKTAEGEFIDMYGQMSTLDDVIQFKDERGKNKSIREKKTDWVYWGGHVWFYHENEKKDKWFMEMMAMNEKYKLFYYRTSSLYIWFWIFDMNDNLVGDKIIIKNVNTWTKVVFNDADCHAAFEKIKKSFGDCPALINELQTQLDNKRNLTCEGYISCPGAKDLKDFLK